MAGTMSCAQQGQVEGSMQWGTALEPYHGTHSRKKEAQYRLKYCSFQSNDRAHVNIFGLKRMKQGDPPGSRMSLITNNGSGSEDSD